MSDYNLGPALTALFIGGIIVGGLAIALIIWLSSHLSIVVRWV